MKLKHFSQLPMSYTSRQNRTRLAAYAVIIPSQMAYNMILTLTPFVNEELKTTDMQYSITFAGYYLMVLLSIRNKDGL